MNTVLNEENKSTLELLQLVSFKIGNEEYGVDILNVQEINKMIQITKVHNTPDFVEGIINLRGRIIPVIDLRTRLSLDKKTYNKDTRIIIVDINSTITGFIVDEVSEVLRVPVSITEAPPSMVGSVNSDYITSIGKINDKLLILLDLNKILSIN